MKLNCFSPMLLDHCPVLSVSVSVTFVYCGQMVGRIKMKLGMPVDLGSSHIVLDGDSDTAPPFRPIAAGWIKMPLGIEVGVVPGDFMLDGDSKGNTVPPSFGPCLLWPNGWMDQDATSYGNRPRPRQLCIRCKPSSGPPPKKNTEHSPYTPQLRCLLVWR